MGAIKFDYEWKLSDGFPANNIEYHGSKVFSCFAGGGGSSMGYKLAGYDVIGMNEVDKNMAECYKTNLDVKYDFVEPIQEFKDRKNLPDELYSIDLLDGSPPCSSFSMSGNREKDWGKKKKFREGQIEQELDKLFFDYIDLVEELKPKVVVAENVKGLLQGQAQDYLEKIYKQLENTGCYVQHFLFNAKNMGVPQSRERVFIICLREDLADPFLEKANLFEVKPELELGFDYNEIPYKEIRQDEGNKDAYGMGEKKEGYWEECDFGKSFSSVHPKGSYFNEIKTHPNKVLPTIRSAGSPWDYKEKRGLFKKEMCKAFGFPIDYDFCGLNYNYLCGMSVPPVMIANIAHEIYKQWLSNI